MIDMFGEQGSKACLKMHFQFDLIANGYAVMAVFGDLGLEFARFDNGVDMYGRDNEIMSLIESEGVGVVVCSNEPEPSTSGRDRLLSNRRDQRRTYPNIFDAAA